MVGDSIKEDARNLKAMSVSQTPLLGEAVAVESVSFDKPSRTTQTPRSLPTRTPMRDTMGINTDGFEETPRFGAKIDFGALPKPKNDFEIVVPSVPKVVEKVVERVEDQYEIEQRRLQQAKLDAQRNKEQQTRAVQLNLPRPIISGNFVEKVKTMQGGLEREMCLLILKDAVFTPMVGQGPLNGVEHLLHDVGELSVEEKKRAEALIAAEMEPIPEDGVLQVDEARRQLDSEVSKAERLSNLKRDYERIKTHMATEASKAVKIEKKLAITLGGYVARSQTLRKSLINSWKSVSDASQELDGFVGLKQREDIAIPRRLESLQREVEELKKRESDMQKSYQEKMERRANRLKE
jgi:pre-mRNA-splicing factor CDC5/CEF1